MKFERNEILTGALVVLTLAVLVGVILILAAPGVFTPLNDYHVFFDNAGGVKPGASVLLAGRRIGSVAGIDSPVPMARRPPKYPEDEVIITVRIDHRTHVYRNATPRMQQNGLLGEQIIDFVGGTEESGLAEPGHTFVGERVPDLNSALPKILDVIQPVASTATLALSDLRETIVNLNSVFNQESELRTALTKLRLAAENVSTLTAPDGTLAHSLSNVDVLTTKLKADDGPVMTTLQNLQRTTEQLNKDNRIEKVLVNFEQASRRASDATRQADALLTNMTPAFKQSASNFEDMTDTLKRQPWRLIWPSTKKYAAAPATAPAAHPHPLHGELLDDAANARQRHIRAGVSQ